MAVTDCADAHSAPATVVADLGRLGKRQSMIDHRITDFPVDFSIAVPPGTQMNISEDAIAKIVGQIVPFLEALKGKVISQFVDIEKIVGYIVTKAMVGNGSLLSLEDTFRAVVAPHGLERKIKVLREVNTRFRPANKLPADFFGRLSEAKKMRDIFAHGVIIFIPKDQTLVPVLHYDHEIIVDDELSRRLCAENYELIRILHTCYSSNFPMSGLTMTKTEWPNMTPEPTPMSGTSAADAPVAPATGAAQL